MSHLAASRGLEPPEELVLLRGADDAYHAKSCTVVCPCHSAPRPKQQHVAEIRIRATSCIDRCSRMAGWCGIAKLPWGNQRSCNNGWWTSRVVTQKWNICKLWNYIVNFCEYIHTSANIYSVDFCYEPLPPSPSSSPWSRSCFSSYHTFFLPRSSDLIDSH